MLKSLLISNKSKSILLKQLQVDVGFSKFEFSEMPTLLRENAAMFPPGLLQKSQPALSAGKPLARRLFQ